MNQNKILSTESKKEGTFIMEKYYKITLQVDLYTNLTVFLV